MVNIEIDNKDVSLLRKILPLICLIIPWEVYFYKADFSNGWGIKFSVFYANFDTTYGTIFVDIFKQMTLLSYGGFLPSVRTLTWIFGAILCIALAIYELSKENTNYNLEIKSESHILLACAALTFISSIATWSNNFKTIPIAPFFFVAFALLLLKAGKTESNQIED